MDDDSAKDLPAVILLQDRGTPYPVYRDITINRAPTDESVRLLSEMQAAAEKKVVQAITVADSTFECVVHRWRDMMNGKYVFRAVFSLNGKKMTAETTIEERKADNDKTAAWITLRDEIAKVIATEAINGALQQMTRTTATWDYR